jgi:L-fuculose-phosphate aldolase
MSHTRAELVQYYRWLRQYGLNDSHSGNASIRKENTVWVTPTGCCADTLKATDLISCKIGENPPPTASADTRLHLAVYASNSTAKAILHGHNPYTIALTFDTPEFTPIDFEGRYYSLTVPVVVLDYPHLMQESPAQVTKILTNQSLAIVRGHGVYAQAPTLNLAYKWLCSLELSAKIAYLARRPNSINLGD